MQNAADVPQSIYAVAHGRGQRSHGFGNAQAPAAVRIGYSHHLFDLLICGHLADGRHEHRVAAFGRPTATQWPSP